MSNSDVIAVVAIVLSAIISITTSLVSYFMNKINIQAKRSEMAFEKRLEAFREIVEQTGKVNLEFTHITSKADFKNKREDFNRTLTNYYHVYKKNSVFLPPSISENAAKFGRLIETFISEDYTDEKADACYKEAGKIEKQIIADMQKFVGYR